MNPLQIISSMILISIVVTLGGCGMRVAEEPIVIEPAESHAPLKLTDDNFQAEVIASTMPVLVDMWAPWCGPCIEMKPNIRQLADDLHGQVKVGELNVADNLFIAQKYQIDKYPTLVLFQDGSEIKRIHGKKTREQLRTLLSDVIHGNDARGPKQ